jgi:hypothetical protein
MHERITILAAGLLALAGCRGPTAPWPVFTPRANDFEVQMPAPVTTAYPAGQRSDGVLEHAVYRSSQGDANAGTLTRYEVNMVLRGNRPMTAEQQLDQYRDDMKLGFSGAKVARETKITLDGHPGRELEIAHSEGKVFARIYLVKSRSYELQVVGRPVKTSSQPEVQTFFNSFKLKP